ncbi:MAG: hypothetical protein HQL78_11360 [Magnetococcales bacterium]|nr:hypothetical protein [Magnetococcales bacterium]
MNIFAHHLLVLSAVLAAVPSVGAAELSVVAYPQNTYDTMDKSQVSDLYLGRTHLLPDGSLARVIDQPRDSGIRKDFFEKVNGMSLNQVNAYWARMTFTGRVLPPETAADSQAVQAIVVDTPQAIGYVPDAQRQPAVKEILHLQ